MNSSGKIIDATASGAGTLPFSPEQRMTVPEFVDWHMILDHELSQLSRPETGVIGSLGFVGLGSAPGLVGPFFGALEKAQSDTTC
jgi:hypothetical protein